MPEGHHHLEGAVQVHGVAQALHLQGARGREAFDVLEEIVLHTGGALVPGRLAQSQGVPGFLEAKGARHIPAGPGHGLQADPDCGAHHRLRRRNGPDPPLRGADEHGLARVGMVKLAKGREPVGGIHQEEPARRRLHLGVQAQGPLQADGADDVVEADEAHGLVGLDAAALDPGFDGAGPEAQECGLAGEDRGEVLAVAVPLPEHLGPPFGDPAPFRREVYGLVGDLPDDLPVEGPQALQGRRAARGQHTGRWAPGRVGPVDPRTEVTPAVQRGQVTEGRIQEGHGHPGKGVSGMGRGPFSLGNGGDVHRADAFARDDFGTLEPRGEMPRLHPRGHVLPGGGGHRQFPDPHGVFLHGEGRAEGPHGGAEGLHGFEGHQAARGHPAQDGEGAGASVDSPSLVATSGGDEDVVRLELHHFVVGAEVPPLELANLARAASEPVHLIGAFTSAQARQDLHEPEPSGLHVAGSGVGHLGAVQQHPGVGPRRREFTGGGLGGLPGPGRKAAEVLGAQGGRQEKGDQERPDHTFSISTRRRMASSIQPRKVRKAP